MATMDEAIPETKPAHAAKAPLSDQRHNARELLASQRQLLDRLEDDLGDRLRQLSEDVDRELIEDVAGERPDPAIVARLAELEEQLASGAETLERQARTQAELRKQLECLQLERERVEQELRVRSTLLGEAQKNEEARRLELATLREQVADLQAQLSASRARHDELRLELSGQVEQLAKAQDEASAARRVAARKYRRRLSVLKDQFDAQVAEIRSEYDARHRQWELEAEDRKQQLQAKLEASHARTLAELEARHAETVEQHEQQRSVEASEHSREQARQAAALEEQSRRLEELEARQAERSAELDRREAEMSAKAAKKDAEKSARVKRTEAELAELRVELEQAKSKLDGADKSGGAATRELETKLSKLQAERDRLAEQLASAQARQTEASKGEDTRKLDEIQRRLDLALEDLREARRANSDLESKLSKARNDPKGSAGGSGGSLNWEAQKEKLLAALEADDRDDEEAEEERQTIEGTIRITDQVVSQKDKEIEQLKRQLSESPTGSSGENKAAVAELLDQDETIRQERERLEAACAEWREKIGKAEIDISVERAKIARERTELDEKMRNFQAELSRRPSGDTTDETAKAPRGRWLARLGLKDLEEKDK